MNVKPPSRDSELLLLENDADKSVFDLLKKGESEIQLSDLYKDVVLVLGNTGAGKSTFTQWIADSNDTLIASEVSEGSGDYIIVDTSDRIGNSTIKSKTVFPELVIDSKTNTAYYDCPGFSDTRSTTNDIATTYFIKKVLDHANSVKLIFVINHSSVRKGVDRQDFMTLVKHITELIKNVKKFQSSVAIVTTKVDNQYVKARGQLVLVPDSRVINAIADFLKEAKQDMENSMKLENISAIDQKFYEDAISFIDAILTKRNEIYTKIGIFRRPDEAGPLSKISILQEGKKHIEIMINNETYFTEKNNDDFGYTISEKSKNDITDLIEEINKTIWSEINKLTDTMQRHYQNLFVYMFDKIKSFVTGTVADAEPSEAKLFLQKLDGGYNETLSLVGDLKNLTSLEELSDKINNTISNIGVTVPQESISNIAYQVKYFNFLELVSEKKFKTRPWEEIIEKMVKFFIQSKQDVSNNVEKIATSINNNLNNTMKEIHTFYHEMMKTHEIQTLPSELNKARDAALNISNNVEGTKTVNEIQKAIQITDEWLDDLDIGINKSSLTIMVNRKNYFNFLQAMSYNDLNTPLLTWICPIQNAVEYLDQSEKWYKYLNSLYLKFSEYSMQKDRNKYNTANVEDWGKADKPQGIVISKNNVGAFLNKTAEYNLEEFNHVKNFLITDLQIDELNQALNIAFKQETEIICEEPNVFIEGTFIKGSDISKIINNLNGSTTCKGFLNNEKFKLINIFALDTVFFDQDLLFSGLGLPVTLISPKWNIIGTRKVDLNGYEGKTHDERFSNKLQFANSKIKDNENGDPGLPGGPGGTFFGIGEYFFNGESLVITAQGGKGGSGQNGQNGQNGVDGSSPWVPKRENLPCESDLCDNHKQINGYDCKKNYYRNEFFDWWHLPDYFYECEYTLFGTKGTIGMKGGDGGKGGKGGNAGNITVISLNNNSEIHSDEAVGEDGADGAGGNGGIGGKNGDDIVIHYKSFNELYWVPSTRSEWELKQRIDKGRVPSGSDGVPGANSKDTQPKQGENIRNPFNIINNYKSFLRKHFSDRFYKYNLQHFLDHLETNVKVKSAYNTLGFIHELHWLS